MNGFTNTMKHVVILSFLLVGCAPKVAYDCTDLSPERQKALDNAIIECIDGLRDRTICMEEIKEVYCKPVSMSKGN